MLSHWANITVEAVTVDSGNWQVWKARIAEMAGRISIDTGSGVAIWTQEEDSLLVGEEEVVARRVLNRRIWGWGKEDIELVDARDEVQGSLGVPYASHKLNPRVKTEL